VPDTVAKVENRTASKISRKMISRHLYRCKARRADTKLRGRFSGKRCGPSRLCARNASAGLENFVRHPQKTFATVSVESRCAAVALGSNISVAAPFVWRCLTGSTMAPFSHPAHRTGQADFPHPALGQNFTPSPTASRAQAGSSVRAQSARKDARVDMSRPCDAWSCA